jgi:cytochrome c oxidase assembly protein Cox11
VDNNGLVTLPNGVHVEVQCSSSRSGDLSWVSSPGAKITEIGAGSTPIVLYQTHDPANNIQSLFIRNFSPMHIALYTCRMDTGISLERSVYITSGRYELVSL